MKELLDQYAAYNAWATRKLLDLLTTLTPEQQHQEINSSFNSLYKTVFHLWTAETIWWRRLKQEDPFITADPFNRSVSELSVALQLRDLAWLDWVVEQEESRLKQNFAYQNSKGEKFNEPIFQILLHLFNHGSYHRGQIVTMLRQAGADQIPHIDFILWARDEFH